MRVAATILIWSVLVAGCSLASDDPIGDPPASTSTTASGSTTQTTTPPTTPPTTDPATVDDVTEPDLTFPDVVTVPYLPMAVGNDTLVTYASQELVTHTTAGSTVTDIAVVAPGIGDFFDVSALLWWKGRFWAFLVGDVSTELGVGSALTSEDGLTWDRVDIGSTDRGARLPGALATPDVPQYEGSTGIQHAAADTDTLAVSGWTRTDAGVQPLVWVTRDGETWSVDAPPATAERAMAVRVTPGDDEVLVHVLGPFYFGQDLAIITPSGAVDASLVGDQYVIDVVRSDNGYVMSSSAFGGPPTALWEWDGRAWTNIAEPDIAPMADDGAGIRPYLLAGSTSGAVASGLDRVSIRRDGSWHGLGSVRGSIVSLSVDGDDAVVVSVAGTDTFLTIVPLGR